jgi:hypothetical protein
MRQLSVNLETNLSKKNYFLRPKQSRNNTRFSKIRCLVELPFTSIKQYMKFRETRYLGIKKNQQHFFILAICYNLRQTPALLRARIGAKRVSGREVAGKHLYLDY